MFEIPIQYQCATYCVVREYIKPGMPYDLLKEDKEMMVKDIGDNEYIIPIKSDKEKSFTSYELRRSNIELNECYCETINKSAAKIGDQIYIYKYASNTINDKMFMWTVSLIFSVCSIFHNIFIKCIKVLIIKLFSAMGVKFQPLIKDNADRMWKAGSPWKALLVIIPQLVLGILAVLTFGLLSTDLNRYIGVLESWSLGITQEMMETQSWQKRVKTHDFIAPCQQPLFPVKKGTQQYKDIEISLKIKDKKFVTLELTTGIPEQLIRSELWLFGPGDWTSSIPEEFIKFKPTN